MPTLAANLEHVKVEPWPAFLPAKYAERTYPAARRASRRWVDGLQTRGGIPRWHGIRRCGRPHALHDVDGTCSYQHHWCKDRACFACAKAKTRSNGQALRDAAERRSDFSLHFVTLTRPREVGESVELAWSRFQKCWEALRHTDEWKVAIRGGLRAMECVWSEGHEESRNRSPGWHVHAHCIIELDDLTGGFVPCPTCSGSGWARSKKGKAKHCRSCTSTQMRDVGGKSKRVYVTHRKMPTGLAALVVRWAAIVQGSTSGQNAVPLDMQNVGQLAKYITKMFELPPDKARDFYSGATGRRILQGFGTWRQWKRWRPKRRPHGWSTSNFALVDIEAMRPGSFVEFYERGASVEVSRNDPAARGRRETPQIPVARVTREYVLEALKRDPRPVWEHLKARDEMLAAMSQRDRDEAIVEHVDKCLQQRELVRIADRIEHPHHFARGRDPPTWDY